MTSPFFMDTPYFFVECTHRFTDVIWHPSQNLMRKKAKNVTNRRK
jgi:hypothetical protein